MDCAGDEDLLWVQPFEFLVVPGKDEGIEEFDGVVVANIFGL